jgi:hypothetical protein
MARVAGDLLHVLHAGAHVLGGDILAAQSLDCLGKGGEQRLAVEVTGGPLQHGLAPPSGRPARAFL